jgi:hypothetical protein
LIVRILKSRTRFAPEIVVSLTTHSGPMRPANRADDSAITSLESPVCLGSHPLDLKFVVYYSANTPERRWSDDKF